MKYRDISLYGYFLTPLVSTWCKYVVCIYDVFCLDLHEEKCRILMQVNGTILQISSIRTSKNSHCPKPHLKPRPIQLYIHQAYKTFSEQCCAASSCSYINVRLQCCFNYELWRATASSAVSWTPWWNMASRRRSRISWSVCSPLMNRVDLLWLFDLKSAWCLLTPVSFCWCH